MIVLEFVDELPWWMFTAAEKEEFQFEKGFDSYHPLGGYYRWREVDIGMELTNSQQEVVYSIITQRKPYLQKEIDDVSREILAELGIPSYNSKFSCIQGLVIKGAEE